jgi:hypothetical protein
LKGRSTVNRIEQRLQLFAQQDAEVEPHLFNRLLDAARSELALYIPEWRSAAAGRVRLAVLGRKPVVT